MNCRVLQKTLNNISYCNKTISWMSCYLEMLYLTVEDGLFYEHFQNTKWFSRKFNWSIEELTKQEVYLTTSLSKDNLH